MHKKFAPILFLPLRENRGSANLSLHARAPGCSAKRDPPEGGGSAAVGFGPSRTSLQTKVFHAATAPGNQGTSSEATWFGEVDGARFGGRGSVPRVRPRSLPTVGPEGDCRASVPLAFQRSPPFPLRGSGGPVRRRGLFGDLGRLEASGAFGVPPGPSGPGGMPPAPTGTSWLPCGPSGPSGVL